MGNRRDLDITTAHVDGLQAQLNIAQFELEHSVVRAPSRGYLTTLVLRPGVYAAKLPLRPAAVFIPQEANFYVAWMSQNSQLRLTLGDSAEIALDGLPGKVFQARGKQVQPVLAEGQMQPGSNPVGVSGAMPAGHPPVVLEITDLAFDPYKDLIPGGAYGQAALYSEHFPHVAILRMAPG